MDAPFDRGEVDRASLEATERLRARLSGSPPPAAKPRGRGALPWVIAGGLFIFTAGMIANPWFEANVRGVLPFTQSATVVAASDTAAVETRLAKLETTADSAAAPVPVERLARSEAKIETSSDQIAREADRVDRLTSEVAALGATMKADHARAESALTTATVSADRAQAMLVLVLARRAVDAGRSFGALDPLLHQSFEAGYPAAVKAVSALGADPVTLVSLRRDFDAMRASIGGQPGARARLNWWEALTTKISSVVGGTATGEVAPDVAAQAALQRGDIVAAATQLRRLPGPRHAELSAWLAEVDRLQLGTQGLAVLENATLLPPEVAAPAAASPAATAAQPAAQPAPNPERKRIAFTFGPTAMIGDVLHRAMSRSLLGFD